jgi:tryptophan aminotransferase
MVSGATASMERRLEVLALARKYKFLILEGITHFSVLNCCLLTNHGMLDDPYYLLYYGDEARPDSYFALEGKGNKGTGIVLRFDSLSKVLSSGLRVGFVTGPVPILDKIDSLVRISCLRSVFTYERLHVIDHVCKSATSMCRPIHGACSLEPLGRSRVQGSLSHCVAILQREERRV